MSEHLRKAPDIIAFNPGGFKFEHQEKKEGVSGEGQKIIDFSVIKAELMTGSATPENAGLYLKAQGEKSELDIEQGIEGFTDTILQKQHSVEAARPHVIRHVGSEWDSERVAWLTLQGIKIAPAEHEKLEEVFAAKIEHVLRQLDGASEEDQLKIAGKFKAQASAEFAQMSNEKVLHELRQLAVRKQAYGLCLAALREDKVYAAYAQAVAGTQEKRPTLSELVVQHGSKELKRRFEEKKLGTPRAHEATMLVAKKASPDDEKKVFKEMESRGVVLAKNASGKPIVSVGEGSRELRVYIADGDPQLFMVDPYADANLRGPISQDEASLLVVAREAQIDEIFTTMLRRESFPQENISETTMPDEALRRITAALLPKPRNEEISFGQPQHKALQNMAKIFVQPDEHYVSFVDKTKFFLDVVKDPDSKECEKLKKILADPAYHRNPPLSVSEVEALLI